MIIKHSEIFLQVASKKTNLSDFGDQKFRFGLNTLVDAVKKDSRISLLGRLIIQKTIIEYLKNRLLIRKYLKEHSEVIDSEIRNPIFIVGLSRTGTTLLHNLLALSNNVRAPKTWELFYPVSPSNLNVKTEKKQIRQVKNNLSLLHLVAPKLKIIHPIEATAIEECYPLINHTFISPAFVLHYGIPYYSNWIKNIDSETEFWVYKEYKSQLQILQHNHQNKKWILKSAVHLYYLDALLEVFPDALVIQTHRDPLDMVPSLCSMMQCFRKIIYKKVQPKKLGPECLSLVQEASFKGLKARQKHNRKNIMDVYFKQLIKDPISQVKKIYKFFNLKWDSVYEERMKQWLLKNPHGKYGLHHYSLEQFGLNKTCINKLFKI